MKIKGKVVRLSMEGGAYGIVANGGKKYFPVNMPNQLKKDGAEISCSIEPTDVETLLMWGEPVYISSFETLS